MAAAYEIDFNEFFTKQKKCALSLLHSRYGLDKDTAMEVYQNACIALYMNVRDGKLVELTCSLSTYFMRICINQALKKLRGKDLEIVIEENHFLSEKVDMILEISGQDDLTERKLKTLHNVLRQLPYPCEDILWYYYGYDMKMNEIAEIIKYADASSVKAKKWQCMQRLNKVLTDKVKKNYID